MRRKFKIMYPSDHHETEKQGKPYLTTGKDMVLMNGSGVFFLYRHDDYSTFVRRLSEVLPKYDVIWKE